MHDTSKIGSFMALRANGWSLAKISKELNISKSTLWEWDNKQQNEIHLLKHLQLEKLQERYLPTYEEELSRLRSYLDRLELALENQDFSKMGPEYVLQMALQLRARLGKMREQVPLRNVPFNKPLTPLPFTGCVSRQGALEFRKEFSEGQEVEDPSDAEPNAPADTHPIGARTACPPETSATSDSASTASRATADPASVGEATDRSADVVSSAHASDDIDPTIHESINPQNQNRTFPDETPPGVENGSLQINGFHKPDPNGRAVLHSENSHSNGSQVNGNRKPHVNGNHHPNGHAHSATPLSIPSSSVDPVSSASSELNDSELRDSAVNPSEANRTFPDETPPGVENGSLQINGLHKPDPNGRPVFISENGHGNGNGKPHVNGNDHPSSNGHSPPETDASVRELHESAVNPSQPGPFVPDGWELSDHVSETGVRLAFPKRKKL